MGASECPVSNLHRCPRFEVSLEKCQEKNKGHLNIISLNMDNEWIDSFLWKVIFFFNTIDALLYLTMGSFVTDQWGTS